MRFVEMTLFWLVQEPESSTDRSLLSFGVPRQKGDYSWQRYVGKMGVSLQSVFSGQGLRGFSLHESNA